MANRERLNNFPGNCPALSCGNRKTEVSGEVAALNSFRGSEYNGTMIDHFRFLAPLYDILISPPDTERLQALLELPAAGTMLDAGGGTGRVSHPLRDLVDDLIVSDETPAMLRQAREKGLCRTVAAAAECLPFADGAFERVLVVDALHHFADQRQAIGELIRVLKPGGRLVVEEPDLKRLTVKFVALAEKVALMRSRFYAPEQIAQMMASHGLQPRIERDERFAAWIVAEK